MSRKLIKQPKAYTLSDLRPEELRERLTAQDFFNSFSSIRDPRFEDFCEKLKDLGLEDWYVYPEIFYRLDINRFKNLARYLEMYLKKTDGFPGEIRDVYLMDSLKDILLKRWKKHLADDYYKFFKGLEEYFLPPKV